MGRGLLAGALALPLVGLAGCEPGEGRYIDDTYFTDTQLVRQADVVYGEAPPLPEALQIDPDDIAASGSSAGAVTALNLAYNAHHPGASNPLTESSAIGAAVVYSGAAYGQLDPNYPPVADIGPGDAPTMDAHCTNDLAVDWNLTKAGIDAAVAAGLVAEYRLWSPPEFCAPGRVHGVDLLKDHAAELNLAFTQFVYRHLELTQVED